jgi:hypothetical protein
MSWIETEGKKYWMPEVLPDPTEEYQNEQESKWYLLPNENYRIHPGWIYDNGAYVDDEYLYQNGGWKLLKNPYEDSNESEIVVKNDISEWIVNEDDRVITATYKRYKAIEPNLDHIDSDRIGLKNLNPESEWKYDEENMTVEKTYDITLITEEELLTQKWNILRRLRNDRLTQTDWILVYALEKNIKILQKVYDYRQQLRDLPSTISDISEYNMGEIYKFEFISPIEEPYFEV